MKFWYKYPQFCEFAQFSLRFPTTRKMMRSLVCLTFLVLSATGDVRDIYQNQNRILSPVGNQPQFGVTPIPALKFDYLRPYERSAAVLRQDQRIDPDGSYNWAYQTSNGISAQEQGGFRLQRGPEPSIAAQGSFSYTSPEGIPISVTYTADENGFRPQGAHLPTPPPIPPAILRALEWNAAHPEPQNPRYK